MSWAERALLLVVSCACAQVKPSWGFPGRLTRQRAVKVSLPSRIAFTTPRYTRNEDPNRLPALWRYPSNRRLLEGESWTRRSVPRDGDCLLTYVQKSPLRRRSINNKGQLQTIREVYMRVYMNTWRTSCCKAEVGVELVSHVSGLFAKQESCAK